MASIAESRAHSRVTGVYLPLPSCNCRHLRRDRFDAPIIAWPNRGMGDGYYCVEIGRAAFEALAGSITFASFLIVRTTARNAARSSLRRIAVGLADAGAGPKSSAASVTPAQRCGYGP
jgi:hypothetical protein